MNTSPAITENRVTIHVQKEGDVTVITIPCKTLRDPQHIQRVGRALSAEVSTFKGKIRLNCAHLDFISTAGLAELIRFNRKVTAAGGKLTVCGIQQSIYKVFHRAKFKKVLPVED